MKDKPIIFGYRDYNKYDYYIIVSKNDFQGLCSYLRENSDYKNIDEIDFDPNDLDVIRYLNKVGALSSSIYPLVFITKNNVEFCLDNSNYQNYYVINVMEEINYRDLLKWINKCLRDRIDYEQGPTKGNAFHLFKDHTVEDKDSISIVDNSFGYYRLKIYLFGVDFQFYSILSQLKHIFKNISVRWVDEQGVYYDNGDIKNWYFYYFNRESNRVLVITDVEKYVTPEIKDITILLDDRYKYFEVCNIIKELCYNRNIVNFAIKKQLASEIVKLLNNHESY